MRSYPTLTHRAGLVVVLLTTACGGGTTEPAQLRSIRLDASLKSLVPDQSSLVTWQVNEADGAVAADQSVTLRSSNTSTLTVDATGNVVAVAPGSADVIATQGNVTARLAFDVGEGGFVTPTGGLIQMSSGRIVLDFPAGAVAAPIAIRFAEIAPPNLDMTVAASSVVAITPANTTFHEPVSITLTFAVNQLPYGLPLSSVGVRRRLASSWEERPTTVPAADGKVTGTSVTTGTYAVGRQVPTAPCVASEYRQFDFWLGAWTVTEGGQAAGLSTIAAEPGGCAIFETFSSGGQGRSITFFEPGTAKWYQTYIDDSGSRLLLSGSLTSANVISMLSPLSGQIQERWVWTANANGTVLQTAAVSQDGGVSFAPSYWNGLYTAR